jgi:hypothetical protein
MNDYDNMRCTIATIFFTTDFLSLFCHNLSKIRYDTFKINHRYAVSRQGGTRAVQHAPLEVAVEQRNKQL